MLNSINHFISLQFDELYNFIYKLTIKDNISDNTLNDLLNTYSNNTSETLAELNNYKIGNTLKWHIYVDKTYYVSKIIEFNKDPQNQNITITKDYLESLNITYKLDSIYTNKNLKNVKKIEGIELIQDINSLKKRNDSINYILCNTFRSSNYI